MSKTNDISRARKQLALELAEGVEVFLAKHHGVWDVDDGRAFLLGFIPMTRAEAEAEVLEVAKDIQEYLPKPTGPSPATLLHKAVWGEGKGGSIRETILKATSDLERLSALERAAKPFAELAGMLHDELPDFAPVYLHVSEDSESFTAGDFRRLAAALSQGGAK